VPPPPPPPPPPPAGPPPPPLGLPPVRPAAAATGGAHAAPPANRPDASALVAPASTGPARPLDLPDATPPARHAAPAAGGADTSEQPAAQRPTAVRPPSVSIQRRPPTRRLEPGDLVCPECGEGNPTTRKFCSRCGTSLESAQVVKRKWWQKLLPRKGPKKRKAGDRPSARKTRKSFPSKILGVLFGGVSRVIGVILIVGGIVYGMVPTIRNNLNGEIGTVKNKVNSWIHPQRKPVIPTTTGANYAVAGHRAQFATDSYSNTYWAAPSSTGRKEPVLTVLFSKKINLKNIVVYNGTGTSQDNYQSRDRPAELHLVYDNKQADDISLTDTADKQTHTIDHGSGITEIQIYVSNYFVTKGDKTMALARIDFFTS
jgi:hypothetical protein